MCSSPRLIAAYHDLHRLSMPRHPPCALLRLISNLCVHRCGHSKLRPTRFLTPDASRLAPAYVNTIHLSIVKELKSEVSEKAECGRLPRLFPRHPKMGLLEISRKEVIQPQVPLRLPCYDFAPVTELTFDGCLLAVSPPASGPPSFHGVTGGVYKARERIHRGDADPRLLAIPASCRRVADDNPN
jgi:hypothetical protein